jgi:hypothetical protein
LAPSLVNAQIFERATAAIKDVAKNRDVEAFDFALLFANRKYIEQGLCRMRPCAISALMILALMTRARKCGAPDALCLMTMKSAFNSRFRAAMSRNVSPFSTKKPLP